MMEAVIWMLMLLLTGLDFLITLIGYIVVSLVILWVFVDLDYSKRRSKKSDKE